MATFISYLILRRTIITNIISVQDIQGISSYNHDGLNRLVKSVRYDDLTTQYTYDVRENRSSSTDAPVVDETPANYSFNALNQLISCDRDGATTTFKYDPAGLRISKTGLFHDFSD